MSELKQAGALIEVLDIQSGTSKAGKEWQKRGFVIETQDQYPKKIAFTLFGDKADMIEKFKVGQIIEVFFNLESREYNGNYFHNVNAWKIDGLEQAGGSNVPGNDNAQSPEPDPGKEDLPF